MMFQDGMLLYGENGMRYRGVGAGSDGMGDDRRVIQPSTGGAAGGRRRRGVLVCSARACVEGGIRPGRNKRTRAEFGGVRYEDEFREKVFFFFV